MPRGQIQKTFKASTFIKNKDLGTRERSQRTKNKTVRYEIVNLDPKIEKKRKKWTSKEASILLEKIQQNGSTDIEALNDPKILKSPDQIKEYLEYCKRNNKTEEVLKINATHANDTKLVRKQNDFPIEDWIALAESVKIGDTKMTSSEQATSGDWSHIVQDALSVIINEEKHPDPEDCDGVDYKGIYQYILDCMNGEVPKKLNPKSAEKVQEMLSELRESAIEAKPKIKEEMDTLEQYTRRDVIALNSKFKSSEDRDMQKLCSLGKVNPLNISSSFFTKKVVIKEQNRSSSQQEDGI